MRIVIQRVSEASVAVGGSTIASIGKGMLLLVGVADGDTREDASKAAEKISKLRIFEDQNGKMNLDVTGVSAEVLSVSQFTLLADISKGNRPGFDPAAGPERAESLWQELNGLLRAKGLKVHTGQFGAHMDVALVNDGPVTIIFDSRA